MFKSKIDLSNKVRKSMTDLCNAHLADAIDLQLQAKQAHWNVKGPQFMQLHEFFDKLHDEAEEFVDLLAERVTALGGVAEGRVGKVAKTTRLPSYPGNIAEGRDHVNALAISFAAFGKGARKAIDSANKAGDADTADLFTEISRETDKQLWFIEAHLQAGR
jgi:starvation-inducible DNA-binding protein